MSIKCRESYERNVDTVYRVCLMYLKNCADVDDAVQNTYMKLIRSGKVFSNEEHEKAWLIVAASSVCKNMLKTAWHRRVVLSEDVSVMQVEDEKADETLKCVMELPDKYKTVIYMHYYEGYSGREIAKLTHSGESTVYSLLHRARKALMKMLREDDNET